MIQTFEGKYPSIHSQARVADSAVVVGDVEIGAQSSIWYGAVLRGDECSIRVGVGSNLQDNCVVHCDDGYPTVVGDHVTVGHGAGRLPRQSKAVPESGRAEGASGLGANLSEAVCFFAAARR